MRLAWDFLEDSEELAMDTPPIKDPESLESASDPAMERFPTREFLDLREDLDLPVASDPTVDAGAKELSDFPTECGTSDEDDFAFTLFPTILKSSRSSKLEIRH